MTSRTCSTSPRLFPAFSIASASRSFFTICSGLCRLRRFVIESLLCRFLSAGNSQNSRISFPGAGQGEYIRRLESGGAGDDGLLQRFQLAVWPDCPKSWRNVDRWPDTAAKQAAFATYERLDRLEAVELAAERDDDEHVPYLRFDERAQERFNGWRAELETRLRSGAEHPAVESHLAKYRSLIPSLALLFHLADEPDGGPVTESALLRALAWAKYLESHARRIYGSIALASLGAAHRLAAKIEEGSVSRGFTLRDVYRNGWSGLTDRKQVAAAVDVLADHNWLKVEEIATDGRSATVHHINPRIRSRAA
ncbi:DUF3987 domain-containing protein [bacterium]|nr:DUF3987 domain-containing protein [bacterium]